MLHWPTTFRFKRRRAHTCTSVPPTLVPSTANAAVSSSAPRVVLGSVPCEILHLIFSELSFKDCIRCMRVCKTWRSIILDWPDMWDTLSTTQGCDIGSDLIPYSAFIHPNAVHKLYFDCTHLGADSESTSATTRMVDFVKEQKCSNISEAELNGYFDTPATFMRFATLTSRSLAHLSIKAHDNQMSTLEVLNTALLFCPQLQTLVCSTVTGWPSHLSVDLLSGLVPHQNLAALAIRTRRQVQLPMQTIIKYLPALRTLSVPSGNCENVDLVLDALNEYCNNIESIRITNSDDTSTSSSLFPLNEPPGRLRELVVADYRLPISAATNGAGNAGASSNPIPTDHLHSLLQKHSATLEILSLGDATALNQATIALLASLDFPSLRIYTRSTGVHDPKPLEYDPHHLCTFLSRCPRLTTLELVDRGTNDQVLQCLESLPSLRSLELQYSDRVSSQALISLLSSQPFEHLSLHSIQAMSDSVLCVLNTSRLKTLRVTLCRQITVGAGLRPLLADTTVLEELEATCVLVNTDTGMTLESILDGMSKAAVRWKLRLHRQNDYYPHPELSLITDVHWNLRQPYYREILARMDS